MIAHDITLYRIENPDDLTGPYNSKEFMGKNQMIAAHQIWRSGYHTPKRSCLDHLYGMDQISEEDHSEYYVESSSALTSLENVNEWFENYLGNIRAAGFQLYRLKASRAVVADGGYQAFYKNEHVTEKTPLWAGKKERSRRQPTTSPAQSSISF